MIVPPHATTPRMDAALAPRLPLSCALFGLGAPRAFRAQAEWAAERGFEGVQIDATSPETRPRDLGRSARRDLGAILRRAELACSGIDLWIPPEHFTDPSRSDRALSAVAEALGLASELAELTGGRPVVCVTLPAGASGDALLPVLASAASSAGATLADHRWPVPSDGSPVSNLVDGRTVGVGIDPVSIILAQSVIADPEGAVSRAGARLASVRLSDFDAGSRVAPGTGRLDLLGYAVSVATSGFGGFSVLDLRGLRDQRSVADRTVARLGRRGSP